MPHDWTNANEPNRKLTAWQISSALSPCEILELRAASLSLWPTRNALIWVELNSLHFSYGRPSDFDFVFLEISIGWIKIKWVCVFVSLGSSPYPFGPLFRIQLPAWLTQSNRRTPELVYWFWFISFDHVEFILVGLNCQLKPNKGFGPKWIGSELSFEWLENCRCIYLQSGQSANFANFLSPIDGILL